MKDFIFIVCISVLAVNGMSHDLILPQWLWISTSIISLVVILCIYAWGSK